MILHYMKFVGFGFVWFVVVGFFLKNSLTISVVPLKAAIQIYTPAKISSQFYFSSLLQDSLTNTVEEATA